MQRNYGKKSSTPFDRLINQQCQKGVSASKSATGVVGRWGKTSFTPTRNGDSTITSSSSSSSASGISQDQPPKKKKFFKSRNLVEDPPPSSSPPPSKVLKVGGFRDENAVIETEKSTAPLAENRRKNKFFTSKTRPPEPDPPLREEHNPTPPVSSPEPSPPLSTHEEEVYDTPTEEESTLKVPPLKLKLSTSSKKNESSYLNKYKLVSSFSGSEESSRDSAKSTEVMDLEGDTNSGLSEASLPTESFSSSELLELKDTETEKEDPPVSPDDRVGLAVKTDSSTNEKQLNNNVDISVPEEKTDSSMASIPNPSLSSANSVLSRASTISSSFNVDKELTLTSASSNVTKRSIFKSKDKGGARKAKYKHKWNSSTNLEEDDATQEKLKRALTVPSASSSSILDFEDESEKNPFQGGGLMRISKTSPDGRDEVTSVKCLRNQKSYFTVVKNVKKAHQIQDSGEFQEFNDDVEYILGGLGVRHSLSTRCLSTITLASKCMEPPFRMHLRAHGTVTKFFKELEDAPDNASLALCAATVLFVLSQDRLNMDLDRDSLELMLNLLDTDSRIKDALDDSGMDERELAKNKQKVKDLCAAMKAKGHAKNLSLDHISADHLAMETLLSLTSKRAGEWFKEELRQLGGLDHLVRTLSDCVNYLLADDITMWTDPLLSKLRKADRVLKVLENVTHENEENCIYLISYEDGKCFDLIHNLFKLLDEEVPLNPDREGTDKESTGFTLSNALMDVIRVYINLVHDYQATPLGSRKGGENSNLMDLALHCLFVVPDYIPESKVFDILVLCLTLLINLVENCEKNRVLLLMTKFPEETDTFFTGSESRTGVEGLISLFRDKESNAKSEESKTDNILDGVLEKKEEEESQKKSREVMDETFAKLLQKAGRHMEDTLIASYIALTIGYLILDNKEHEKVVRESLPEQNFSQMLSILKKFFNFMNLTASSTVASCRAIKATERIIKYLENIDKPQTDIPKVKNEDSEENFDDITLFDISKDESSLMEDAHDSSFDDFGKI